MHTDQTPPAPGTWLANNDLSGMIPKHEILRRSAVNDIQHGGDHYKKYGNLQPWDVITAWNLGYLEGTALKYIARWRDKNGIEDLNKAIHFLQKAVEVYASRGT